MTTPLARAAAAIALVIAAIELGTAVLVLRASRGFLPPAAPEGQVMVSVIGLLLLAALVITVAHVVQPRVPLWAAVVLILVVLLLRVGGLAP